MSVPVSCVNIAADIWMLVPYPLEGVGNLARLSLGQGNHFLHRVRLHAGVHHQHVVERHQRRDRRQLLVRVEASSSVYSTGLIAWMPLVDMNSV